MQCVAASAHTSFISKDVKVIRMVSTRLVPVAGHSRA